MRASVGRGAALRRAAREPAAAVEHAVERGHRAFVGHVGERSEERDAHVRRARFEVHRVDARENGFGRAAVGRAHEHRERGGEQQGVRRVEP